MNYKLTYTKLLAKYGTDTKPFGVYTERHHIVPKSVGGTNESANLVYLPARCHFIAHHLLTKVYKDSPKLKFAFWAMCNQLHGDVTREYQVTSMTYATAKAMFAIENSKLHKGKKISDKRKQELRVIMTGNTINPKGPANLLYGIPRLEVTKAKISATKALHPEKAGNFKGYYITPEGSFASAVTAARETAFTIDTIRSYCKDSTKVVTAKMIRMSPSLREDMLGKTLKHIGWGFDYKV